MLADERSSAAADVDPLAPKPPHGRTSAKRVIFLNMSGGASHVDSFDYKPKLFGCTVAEDEVHIHDFHATILHLLGLDHQKLTYRHAGRDFRLTDVAGRIVREIVA